MKNGSTPNPARDAAETKEAYIVVEIMGGGGYGDSNLFFDAISAVNHICNNPPNTDPMFKHGPHFRNYDDFLFNALPSFYKRASSELPTHVTEDMIEYHVRKISLSHQQQDGSAPQLDQITREPEPNPTTQAAKALADHFETILQERDNPLCEALWKELQQRGWDIEQTQPGKLGGGQ